MDKQLDKIIIDNFQISNPFPGLRSFEEDENILFFGREKQVDDLIRKLRKNRFLGVIGTSGSGKSSLVKSGLLPSLYGGFMAGAGSNWRTVTFRPGINPIGNLAKALNKSGDGILDKIGVESVEYSDLIETTLRRSNQGLVEYYKQNTIDKNEYLLILIDQFEEIFRFSEFEKSVKEGHRDSTAFINLLLKTAEQSEYPIYIVFTMRSDFLGDCTGFKGLPEAINDGHYLVPRMTRDQCREAIEGPIAVGRGEISPGLVNRLLNDVGDNPDQLPILQHSLMRIWDYWEKVTFRNGPIDISHYESIGTMKQALSLHAEEAFIELPKSPDEKYENLCKSIFKSLTDSGSDNRGIRRPTKISEIMNLTQASFEDISLVANLFRTDGRAFLMPPFQYELTENSVLDISHESLMRVWKRLVGWVEEESESIQMYLRLSEASNQYEQRKGGLWRDPELSLAVKWKNENKPSELWAGRINNDYSHAMLFFDYSIDQQIREDNYKEYQQKSRLRRARIFAISISAVALVAVGLASWAYKEKEAAAKARIIAETEKSKANKQTLLANAAKLTAESAKKDADIQKEKAEKSAKDAEKSAQDALVSAANANQSALAAKNALASANTEKKRAEDNEVKANEAAQKVTRLKAIADIDAMALSSINSYVQKDYTRSKNDALSSYVLSTASGDRQNNSSLVVALWSNWNKQINYSNVLDKHQTSIKHFTYLNKNHRVISVDEKNVAWVSKINDGKISELSTYKFAPENVLALSEIDNSRSEFLVLFSDGRLEQYKLEADKIIFLRKITDKLASKGLSQIKILGSNIYVLSNGLLTEISGWSTIPNKTVFDNVSAFDVKSGKSNLIVISRNNIIESYKLNNNLINSPKIVIANLGKLFFNASAIEISPDGNELALGSNKGKFLLLSSNIPQTEDTRKFDLHNSQITGISWIQNLNGTYEFVTSSFDHQIKIFNMNDLTANTNIVKIFAHDSWIYRSQWIDDGNTSGLLSCSEDRTLKFNVFAVEELYKKIK